MTMLSTWPDLKEDILFKKKKTFVAVPLHLTCSEYARFTWL